MRTDREPEAGGFRIPGFLACMALTCSHWVLGLASGPDPCYKVEKVRPGPRILS